ncbi:MAG: SUMF1/EgtB/PvdO family nonheme iron enzyme [Magnetococcales bacterium]|nr:SUMF1/EgtB/PvdO family nonheme iron enzyme [Magnetococcales bacterium]
MSGEGFSDALPPGTRLLWFEIVKVLGKGGFGITYLGRDTNQKQWVAIKEYLPSAYAARGNHHAVLPHSPADAKTFDWGLDRFLKEAQTLAQFHHPSIVRVTSFFRSGNTAYMVMEYVEGEGLDSLLRRHKTLDEATLKKLLPLLLDGLEILHKADYIHRDIKPPNIFLRKTNDMPVLLDFGSARQSVAGRSEQMTSLLSMGYSPFEQYDSTGSRQGPWSDIYAMGGVLYRAITGQKPLEASIRAAARLRNAPDPLPAAEEMGKGLYSTDFLRAVDLALRVVGAERPQSIQEWRPLLLGPQAVAMPVGTLRTQGAGEMGDAGVATGKTTSWRGFISSLNAFSSRTTVSERLGGAMPDVIAPKPGEVRRITPVPLTSAPNAAGVTPGGTLAGWEIPAAVRKAGTLWEEPATKMEFVWVPGGVFLMGSALADPNRKEDEGPEHEVQLDGFWMGKYPLTWGKWRRIMGDYPPGLFMNSRAHCPVERITWLDVQKFIDKLGHMIGAQYTFRLPTEAEWEYAARAGAYVLPFLQKSTLQFGTEYLPDYAWFRANAHAQSHPVGEKKANAWGLHDMLGNVWEWVNDRYQADYYGKSPRINPQGPPGGGSAGYPVLPASRFNRAAPPREMRVARGGGFNSMPSECWPTSRLRMAENASALTVGFRLVRQE